MSLLVPLLSIHEMMGQSECSFSLGNDTTICFGSQIVLEGPPGMLEYEWNTGWGTPSLVVSASGVYHLTVTSYGGSGNELVVNGDFSDGPTGFTSDYELSTTVGGFGLLSDEGQYVISTDPSLTHNNFASCGDHTSGTGNMMVVNGASTANVNVWCSSIEVQPNTTYAFSAWLMTVFAANPAQLEFTINGETFGAALVASPLTCEWDQFYALWNSGAVTTAEICITNQNTEIFGNDFALDDISFSTLCSYTDTIEVNVLPPAPLIDLGEGVLICPGDEVVLDATVSQEWPLEVSYLWNTGAIEPIITVSDTGEYAVVIEGDCLFLQDTITIIADTCDFPPEESDFTIPNIFSPNGDGFNDQFGPIIQGELRAFEMEIYNRWGQKVYTISNPGRTWSGRSPAGIPLSEGTYYYIVHALVLRNGEEVDRDEHGYFTLVR